LHIAFGICVGATATALVADLNGTGSPLPLLALGTAVPLGVIATAVALSKITLPVIRTRLPAVGAVADANAVTTGASTRPAADEAVRRRLYGLLEDPEATKIVFQPIIELSTSAVRGVEAFTRFVSEPTRPPNEWFDEADGVGLRIPLEIHAFRLALAHLDALPGEFLAINLSPAVLVSPAFAEILVQGAPALRRVVVELTEPASTSQYDNLLTALHRLRANGGRLAVDDSGGGYSNFSRILEIRPEFIKIDRTFVSGALADPARRALVNAAADFAAEIGAIVIAEGVEHRDEISALRAAGISLAQGFLFGPPGPLPIAATPSASAIAEPLRVLIADDDAVVRALIAKVVRRAGLVVVGQAGDGDEAMRQAAQLKPDVVILDFAMPVKRGDEALPEIRARLPDARIFVLSASWAALQGTQSVRDLGADRFIKKEHALTFLPAILAGLTTGREVSPIGT